VHWVHSDWGRAVFPALELVAEVPFERGDGPDRKDAVHWSYDRFAYVCSGAQKGRLLPVGDYLYLPGVASLYRYRWEDETFTLDEDWGFVTVTEEGDLTALTPNLTEDWAILQLNTGSPKPMPVWAISTSDSSVRYSIQPFDGTPVVASFSAAHGSLDPDNGLLYAADTGAGLASAGARHYSTREICTVTLQRMDTPVIAAVNGVAAGYGLDLALGCDMRIMSDKAILMPGFAKMGVIPESGGTWYLPRLLGWAKACEISMLGDPLGAAAAEACGLVNRAVAAEDLEAVALEWTEKIANNAPLAIAEMKRLFRHGLTQDFESHSHHVLMSILNLFKSEDFREGVQSFVEKRPPEFKGR